MGRALWHGAGMEKRNSLAGGFLLMVAIIAGFAWGVAAGQPMLGVMSGTAVGIAAAVLLWLVDRRR